MVKMPAHQLALTGPGLLLNRVVKDQHTVVTLNRSDGRFDLMPQVLGGAGALEHIGAQYIGEGFDIFLKCRNIDFADLHDDIV